MRFISGLGATLRTFFPVILIALATLLHGPSSTHAAGPGGLITAIADPTTAGYDEFGWALHQVGNLLFVGAAGDNAGADNAGSVYGFNSSGALSVSLNNPEPAVGDYFGWSLAPLGTNKVIVSAPLSDFGAVDSGTVFVMGTNGTKHLTIRNPDPQVQANFGRSVGFIGDDILIGSMRHDAGAPDAGSAYVYDGTTGELMLTLDNPEPNANDLFGCHVASAGTTILVSTNFDDFETTNSGTVYLFDGDPESEQYGELKRTLRSPDPQPNDLFGFTTYSDGTRIIVAAPNKAVGNFDRAGVVYVFDDSSDEPILVLPNPEPADDALFGYHGGVFVGSDIFIGRARYDVSVNASDPGSAYLFDSSGQLRLTLRNPTPASGDSFGITVAAFGNRMVVGDFRDDTGGTDAGRVYLFESADAPTMTPSPTPTPAPVAEFSLSPAATTLQVGQTVQVTINANSNGTLSNLVRAGLQFDPAIFQIQGNVVIPAASPYRNSITPPVISTGQVTFEYRTAIFGGPAVAYNGPIATITLLAKSVAAASNVTLIPGATRFVSTTMPVELEAAVYAVLPGTPSPTPSPSATPTPTPSPTPGPYLRLSPASASITGSSIVVSLQMDSFGSAVRGGAAIIQFDPADFSVSEITQGAGSPFALNPVPLVIGDQIEITFVTPSLNTVAHAGTVATFRLTPLGAFASSSLTLDPSLSRFTPDVPGTALQGATYRIDPSITVAPASSILSPGDVLHLTINADTVTSTARAGAAVLKFDPEIFEVVGGVGGITRDDASPFTLAPPASITGDTIEIPFVELSFASVNYRGPIIHLDLQAIAPSTLTAIEMDRAETRFSFELPNTRLAGGVYAVRGTGWASGDFDDSGCTDVVDFFIMLDNWQAPYGVVEFLSLIDNWRTGDTCS